MIAAGLPQSGRSTDKRSTWLSQVLRKGNGE
jgi:hypothetical protein